MNYRRTLLERFLRNECSERENRFVFHALRDGLVDDGFLAAIGSVMSDEETDKYIENQPPVSEEILKNLRRSIRKERTKKSPYRRIIPDLLKITAAVLVTLSVTWLCLFIAKEPEPVSAMNTITVPVGQTVYLKLSDGTGIWLNSRTTMQYPSAFKSNLREIVLDGEAFFEVAHNAQKPFVVHAGKHDIEVLGTEFNVEAYSQSNDFATALLNGSVKITNAGDTAQKIVLRPGTLARSLEGKLVSETITDFNHYRWREGLISFKDMSFPDLMMKFEKCYGIQIVVENRYAKDYVCTGKFRRSDGIDYALRVLQRDARFTFSRDEEQQIIYIR